MFSGLLVCADCGCNLHFHFNQGNPKIKYFNCSNYKCDRGTYSSTHYIRANFQEEVMLAEIKRLTRFVNHYEKEFAALMMGFTQQAAEDERKIIQKELRTKIKALQDDIERTKSKAATADMFISAVRKYTRARKLTPRMLDKLVQRIEVHQTEKVDGVWVQRLTIHYNCFGAITLPDADIIMNTRKGGVCQLSA